jgi:hypothetical protein
MRGYTDTEMLTEEEYFARKALEPMPTEKQIAILKQKLADTDYAVIKIAEGVATVEEYTDVITQRQAWRTEISQLEPSVD